MINFICFTLWSTDMTLFGICPEQEEIILVVCKECGRVVKASALLRHCGKFLHEKIFTLMGLVIDSTRCDKDSSHCHLNILSLSALEPKHSGIWNSNFARLENLFIYFCCRVILKSWMINTFCLVFKLNQYKCSIDSAFNFVCLFSLSWSYR